MRIIAEKDPSIPYWSAWWDDEPDDVAMSASVYGAVAKLLMESNDRNFSIDNVTLDQAASGPNRVEMVVIRRPGE